MAMAATSWAVPRFILGAAILLLGAATDALNDVAVMVPWLNAALSLPLCAALAWVSHVGVERPCAAAAHSLGRQSGRDQ